MSVPYTFNAGSPTRPGAQLDANFLAITSGASDNTSLVTTAGPVVMGATDLVVILAKTVGAATQVTLPANPTPGRRAVVWDANGDSETNAITIVGAAGEIINGASSLTVNTPYGVAALQFTGTVWLATKSAPPAGGSVVAKVASYAVLASDSGTTFNNLGASGAITLTLPTPAVGLTYSFVTAAAQNMILDVGGSVVIGIGEIATSPGGQVACNSPYSAITLKALSTTLWVAVAMTGSWNPV